MSQTEATVEKEATTELHPLVSEIAEALEEPNVELLVQVFDTIGEERTQEFFEKTKETEANGGMLTISGKRRRTPGGTFFQLVKKGLKKKERKSIWPKPYFGPDSQSKQEPPTWPESLAYVQRMLENPQKGTFSRAKITLIGRPKQVAKSNACTVAVVPGRSMPQSMPKGLPKPPDAQLSFAVFIADRQWNRVKASLQEHKDDELIIEGYTLFDPRKKVTAILAQSVTSKMIQRGKQAK